MFLLLMIMLIGYGITIQANVLSVDKIFIFGDSLSDEGVQDVTTMPSGKSPTFTTKGDAVWPTDLALLLGIVAPTPNNLDFEAGKSTPTVSYTLQGTDYAAGGATTGGPGEGAQANVYEPPALETYTDSSGTHIGQVNYYLAHHQIDPNGLYVIWASANDIFVEFQIIMQQYISHPDNPPSAAEIMADFMQVEAKATNNIVMAAKQLHAAATVKNIDNLHLVILDLPNLAILPEFATLPVPPKLKAELIGTLKLVSYNMMLNLNSSLSPASLGFKIIGVDAYSPLNAIYTTVVAGQPYTFLFNGQSNSITNVTNKACGNTSALLCTQLNSNNDLFADGVHPTGLGHRVIANAIYKELTGG